MSTGFVRDELVAVLLAEHLDVGGERRRVAGDVDELRRAELARPPERLAGETGPRRVDDDHVRRPGALGELLQHLADVAREEGRVADLVQVEVLERARDRLLRDVDAPDAERMARQREPDRAGTAVEVVDRLGPRQPGVLDRERVELLRHLGVRLQEGVRADAEALSEQLLLDRVVAPEQRRGEVRHLRGLVVDRPVDRLHLREAPQHLDEVAALELLTRRGHEHDQHLARVAPLAVDEVAEIAGVLGLVVRLEVLLARPVADGVPDGVAEVGREPALLDLEHLVPAPGLDGSRAPGRTGSA